MTTHDSGKLQMRNVTSQLETRTSFMSQQELGQSPVSGNRAHILSGSQGGLSASLISSSPAASQESKQRGCTSVGPIITDQLKSPQGETESTFTWYSKLTPQQQQELYQSLWTQYVVTLSTESRSLLCGQSDERTDKVKATSSCEAKQCKYGIDSRATLSATVSAFSICDVGCLPMVSRGGHEGLEATLNMPDTPQIASSLGSENRLKRVKSDIPDMSIIASGTQSPRVPPFESPVPPLHSMRMDDRRGDESENLNHQPQQPVQEKNGGQKESAANLTPTKLVLSRSKSPLRNRFLHSPSRLSPDPILTSSPILGARSRSRSEFLSGVQDEYSELVRIVGWRLESIGNNGSSMSDAMQTQAAPQRGALAHVDAPSTISSGSPPTPRLLPDLIEPTPKLDGNILLASQAEKALAASRVGNSHATGSGGEFTELASALSNASAGESPALSTPASARSLAGEKNMLSASPSSSIASYSISELGRIGTVDYATVGLAFIRLLQNIQEPTKVNSRSGEGGTGEDAAASNSFNSKPVPKFSANLVRLPPDYSSYAIQHALARIQLLPISRFCHPERDHSMACVSIRERRTLFDVACLFATGVKRLCISGDATLRAATYGLGVFTQSDLLGFLGIRSLEMAGQSALSQILDQPVSSLNVITHAFRVERGMPADSLPKLFDPIEVPSSEPGPRRRYSALLIPSTMPVIDAFAYLIGSGAEAGGLIDSHGTLMGHLSLSDLRFLLHPHDISRLQSTCGEFWPDLLRLRDQETAFETTVGIFTVSPEASLRRVIQLACAARVHTVWVTLCRDSNHTSGDFQPVGVITTTDIIRVLLPSFDLTRRGRDRWEVEPRIPKETEPISVFDEP